MALLATDWGYSVNTSELNPNDPQVNTASEYMYQMATIAYHTLHGSTTVILDKDVDYNGQTYAAGSYEFVNDGRYWTGFDRENPIEGPAREQIWTGTAHALIAELGVGSVTAPGSPDRSGRGRPPRRLRRHDPAPGPRPGVGDARRDRACQGSGSAAGDHDRLEPRTGFPTRNPATNGVGHQAHAVQRARQWA